MPDPTPTNATPTTPPAVAAAPVVASPSAPDLGGLNSPGALQPGQQPGTLQGSAAPNPITDPNGPYQTAVAGSNAAAQKLAADAAQSTTVPPPKHATLLRMVEGLGIALSSSAEALRTRGASGGAPEVADFYQKQQQQKIQAQQAATAAHNEKVQSDIAVLDANNTLANSVFNTLTLPNKLAQEQLEQQTKQQELTNLKQGSQIQLAEFQKANWGFTPQELTGSAQPGGATQAGGGPGASGAAPASFDPAHMANAKGMLTRSIGPDSTAAKVLGANDPAVQAVQAVIANPNATPQDVMRAGQGLQFAVQQTNEAATIGKAQGEAAKVAPLGQQRADAYNTMLTQRYQVLNPNQPLPEAYKLNANSTPEDFNRVDKVMDSTEKAQATKTQLGFIDAIRQQTFALSGMGPIQGDPNKEGAAYLASLPPQERSAVQAIGTGHMTADRLGYLIYRNPRIVEEVVKAYPDFDSSKAAAYPKTYVDFTSGKTSQQLNAGATALKHLRELDELNTIGSIVYGTPAYTAYQNKLNTVANELVQFYHMNGTDMSISAVKAGLGARTTYNRRAAIRTQAASMADKFGSYEQQWDNAAPSAVYENQMPTIDPDAKSALAYLDPNFVQNHPRWGTVPAQSSPAAAATAAAAAPVAPRKKDPFFIGQ